MVSLQREDNEGESPWQGLLSGAAADGRHLLETSASSESDQSSPRIGGRGLRLLAAFLGVFALYLAALGILRRTELIHADVRNSEQKDAIKSTGDSFFCWLVTSDISEWSDPCVPCAGGISHCYDAGLGKNGTEVRCVLGSCGLLGTTTTSTTTTSYDKCAHFADVGGQLDVNGLPVNDPVVEAADGATTPLETPAIAKPPTKKLDHGPWSQPCKDLLSNPVPNDEKPRGMVNETEGIFFCGGGYCVPKDQRCDGLKNCHDGSDEFGCSEGDGGDVSDPEFEDYYMSAKREDSKCSPMYPTLNLTEASHRNLGGFGPDDGNETLRFEKVVKACCFDVDLIITADECYAPVTPETSGPVGPFVSLSLAGDRDATFTFDFIDPATNLPVDLPRFAFTFYDLAGGFTFGGKNELYVEVCGDRHDVMLPNDAKVKVLRHEDCTKVESFNGEVETEDAVEMTTDQKSVTAMFTFHHQSSFTVKLGVQGEARDVHFSGIPVLDC